MDELNRLQAGTFARAFGLKQPSNRRGSRCSIYAVSVVVANLILDDALWIVVQQTHDLAVHLRFSVGGGNRCSSVVDGVTVCEDIP